MSSFQPRGYKSVQKMTNNLPMGAINTMPIARGSKLSTFSYLCGLPSISAYYVYLFYSTPQSRAFTGETLLYSRICRYTSKQRYMLPLSNENSPPVSRRVCRVEKNLERLWSPLGPDVRELGVTVGREGIENRVGVWKANYLGKSEGQFTKEGLEVTA